MTGGGVTLQGSSPSFHSYICGPSSPRTWPGNEDSGLLKCYILATFLFGVRNQVSNPYKTAETTETQKLIQVTVKGKAIALQAWTGPEVSRTLRLPDFKTVGTWGW
jgi:hypothetical protein